MYNFTNSTMNLRKVQYYNWAKKDPSLNLSP